MFAVVWMNKALDELADVYVAVGPAERTRIAAGVDALNHRLAADPLNEGESRVGGYRMTFPDLLAVSFHVNQASGVVRVVGVSRYGRP
jgi:hypothetical protein